MYPLSTFTTASIGKRERQRQPDAISFSRKPPSNIHLTSERVESIILVVDLANKVINSMAALGTT